MKRNSQNGVALVVTLIMLSIITVITVAFLAVTTRETGSVANSSFGHTTVLMTEGALERARAEIASFIVANTNRFGPDLLVSRNVDGAVVPYDESVIANLYQEGDPRPPVFVETNALTAPEFRFWLDLDRNGFFTETGLLPEIDEFGNLTTITNFQTGDPQWIGVLEDPLKAHGRDNRFIGRYAYIVLPVGKALDLNFIHNNAKRSSNPFRRTEQPGFLRNQGVGSWEANLAAFLADLNTNWWGSYLYVQDPSIPSGGLSFDHATELLTYRYAGSFQNLFTADQQFPRNSGVFTSDSIDAYANGPILPLTLGLAASDDVNDDPSLPWPGSDGVNHFFSVHDFFKVSTRPTYSNFVNRLRQSTAALGTYNETTYYRMLEMLGTDSAPESEDPFVRKLNLNYVGADSTNLVEWDSAEFFLTVADRLLEDEFGDAISVQSIPVYTNLTSRNTNGVPLYSPRIHQLLQIAANITDARRGAKAGETYPYYPSVFRPQFEVVGPLNEVYITNYVEEPGGPGSNLKVQYANSWYDIVDPFDANNKVPTGNPNVNFYGIPTILGAKKGFPNFNEITTMTTVQVGRKLEFRKTRVEDKTPNQTNQMYTIGISNSVAVEAWNSYSGPYPRTVEMVVANVMSTTLTNDAGLVLRRLMATNHAAVYPAGTWAGTGVTESRYNVAEESFKVTPPALMMTLPDSVYYLSPVPRFEPISSNNLFEDNQSVYTNQWGLSVTNKLLFFLYDDDHLVDMVAMSDLSTEIDVSRRLAGAPDDDPGGLTMSDRLWQTDPWKNVNEGVRAQIEVSRGQGVDLADWRNFGGVNPSMGGGDIRLGVDKFAYFLDRDVTPKYGSDTNELAKSLSTVAQAPFTPLRRMHAVTTWEANDPLVQDLADHLRDFTNHTTYPPENLNVPFNIFSDGSGSLGERNRRYQPWKHPVDTEGTDGFATTAAIKDPGMISSDMWNFPTNKFPSIGWLGRVHRGTPWQTIYLKSVTPGAATWRRNVGAAYMGDEMPTAPVNDWRLVDHFSAALHPNATRGTLSVNQTGLAAWSAVLSGVPVTTLSDNNSGGISKADTVIEPALLDSPLQQIVDSIAAVRAGLPGGRFEGVGEILAAGELTDNSPFLNPPFITVAAAGAKPRMLTDEDYERIPQQILSLLKVGDARFVVYSFGQALSPANRSILPSGPFFGMCTNYQVTGESASRAVIRVDFDRGTNGLPAVLEAHAKVERFNSLEIE